ncbi:MULTISPECIES: HAD family hydrolase [unclassified Nocardia]|uniref:HAD family hydrolase n=1 Tax=unclassified Nocardia TaxID=2637762 RepID=UPI001CE411B4|nr:MULTISPECIES: HAD family hydrolase [unclassified Nocardia]
MNGPNYRTVLWDLDGTLIGLRRRTFRMLMPAVAAWWFRDLVAPHRFLLAFGGVLKPVRANDSTESNTDLMVRLLAERLRIDRAAAGMRFHDLAVHGFSLLRWCFPPVPAAVHTVGLLRAARIGQVIATNPLWPRETVETRLRWGGYDPAAFELITSGDTMRRSKPSIEFYRELLDRLGARPRDCVMIGNDAANDAPAAELGIPVFLVNVPESDVPQQYSSTGLVTTGDWSRLHGWLGIEEKSCSSS